MKRRLLNLAIALDQLLLSLLTLGKSHPDETISAALWRHEQRGTRGAKALRRVVDALFWPLESDHCQLAYLSEMRGDHLPTEYRT